jgi:hypothetical protein
MAIEKKTEVDEITVSGNDLALYREVTIIMEDNVEISRSYHRTSLKRGDDLSKHPERVVAVCRAAWD